MGPGKEKILVRGVNWIGDAVMTMPALRALRTAYPDAKLSLLVKPTVAPLFENNPDIDEVLLYEEGFNGIAGRARLALKLRKMKFSKAILFQNAFDAALIVFAAGIPERIGYGTDGRGWLLTSPVKSDGDARTHHINYYLRLLMESGIKAGYSRPRISLALNERLTARSLLSELKRPVLGINPGAAYGSAKRWLPERFAETANWFIKDTGGGIVIFGGQPEIEIAEEIFIKLDPAFRAPQSSLSLAGKTSLRELIPLISECDVFLTNDSGPMHIAYAVGTPLVAIFGSTCPSLTGPQGDDHAVIKSDLSCSPCFDRTCRTNDLRCMYGITSEEVYHGIKDVLPKNKAVFFDRDGTLCKDANYLSRWDDLEILPGLEHLKGLKEKGFILIGVSNQSGIQRGIVDESFAKEVNQVFVDRYGLDDFYYCPHHPDERCGCRKPEPGMLFEARARHGINLRESYVVGDKDADVLLAKAVGAKAILVLTGQHKESQYADFVARDLKEAVDFIIRNGKTQSSLLCQS